MNGPSVWDLLLVAFASIGFVTFMGIVAFAFEPYYKGARERFVIRLKSMIGAWRWREPKKPDYGCLPASWARGGRQSRRKE